MQGSLIYALSAYGFLGTSEIRLFNKRLADVFEKMIKLAEIEKT